MKRYQIIYADPPWDYRDKNQGAHKYGKIAPYYSGMTTKEISLLPINLLTEQNCILFLWATFPNLQEALDVILAWGFTYKTLGFSWIKTNSKNGKPFFGIGHYTKSNCEVCLIGLKGKLEPLKQSNRVSSVIIAPREKHSKKPDIIRDKIVEFCGDLPRIELFAREKTEGWDVWGNEVESDIEL